MNGNDGGGGRGGRGLLHEGDEDVARNETNQGLFDS